MPQGEPHAPRPGAEHLAEPLRTRWSPSVFDDTHVLDRRDVETLLHAAQWAPSAGNWQPWAFVVAERGSASHEVLVAHLSRGNAGWVPRAAVVFVTATQTGTGPDGREPKGVGIAHHDLGQAAAHLVLQAHAMGLFAHQFAGFDHDAVAAGLDVPAHYTVVSGIAVGRRGDPAEVPDRDREREQRVRSRRGLSEIAWGATWGSPWVEEGR